MAEGPQDKRALGRIALQQRPVMQPRAGGGLPEQAPQETSLAALKALSEQHGVPGIDLTQVCIRLDDLDLIPREIGEKHGILPVLVRSDRVFVAMITPTDKHIVDELEFVTGKKVYPYVALPAELKRVMAEAYDLRRQGEAFFIGSRCPQEMLIKMGAVSGPDSERPPAAETDELVAPTSTEPGVVMDDATGRAAESADLSDSGFPNTSEELSVVTDLPLDPKAPRAPRVSGAKTILVVDDEADIRKMLKRLLTDRGYDVLEADRGLQALRIVKEKVPNLIILDAMLPEVHGFEIARRIKGSKRYGHIPIIMVSAVYRGWRYAEDVKTSYGVDAYIEKPFRIADMIKAIESVVMNPAVQQAEQEQTSSDAEQALADGVAAYQAGDLDGAIRHLERGVSIDPLAYRLHFHLGLLHGKRAQAYEAIQHLETALQINPKHFPAMKNLAVLYQKTGFRNKAIETWERAIAVAPDDETKQSIKELLLSLL